LPRKVCLLDSVGNAEHFLADCPDLGGWALFASHYSVVDYLEDRGIRCEEISSLLQFDDYSGLLQRQYPGGDVYADVRRSIEELDSLVTDDFWRALGTSERLPLFSSMFDYLFHVASWGYVLLTMALDRAVEREGSGYILTYEQPVLPGYLGVHDVVCEAARRLDLEIEVRESCVVQPTAVPVTPVRRSARSLVGAVWGRLFGGGAPKSGGPVNQTGRAVVLMMPEHDLRPLTEQETIKVCRWSTGGPLDHFVLSQAHRERGFKAASILIEKLKSHVFSPLWPPTFWGRLVQEIGENGHDAFAQLACLDDLIFRREVCGGIWAFSPGALISRNLLVSRLLRSGLPVMGRQHGGNYGAQNCGFAHYLSDFLKCTHFLGNGFDKREIEDGRCPLDDLEVLKVGSYKDPSPESLSFKPKTGHVVFPITNCFSLTMALRMSPNELAKRQLEILHALDSRKDLTTWVKPFDGADDTNFAHSRAMRRMRHLRWVSGGVRWVVEQRRPQLVVIEYPSSPLFELLPYDVDIFLLMDPLLPFSEEAVAMLRERAYIFEGSGEMARAILEYGVRPCERLRDDSYYRKYIWKPGARENLLREVGRAMHQ